MALSFAGAGVASASTLHSPNGDPGQMQCWQGHDNGHGNNHDSFGPQGFSNNHSNHGRDCGCPGSNGDGHHGHDNGPVTLTSFMPGNHDHGGHGNGCGCNNGFNFFGGRDSGPMNGDWNRGCVCHDKDVWVKQYKWVFVRDDNHGDHHHGWGWGWDRHPRGHWKLVTCWVKEHVRDCRGDNGGGDNGGGRCVPQPVKVADSSTGVLTTFDNVVKFEKLTDGVKTYTVTSVSGSNPETITLNDGSGNSLPAADETHTVSMKTVCPPGNNSNDTLAPATT